MTMDLGGKIGGIPVPVIGGVIGLGLVGFLYFKQSSNAAAASAAPSLVAVPDLGPGDQVDSTGTQDGGTASSVPMFGSNGTWTATALAWETTTWGTSPLTTQAAISKYLTGEALTQAEAESLNRIIAKFGLPPQGVTGISTIIPKSIPLKDPTSEVPDPTPVNRPNLPPVVIPAPVKTPTYTSQHFDASTGITSVNLSNGTTQFSDRNTSYKPGTYMAGGNLYNADGSAANAQAQGVQDRIALIMAGKL